MNKIINLQKLKRFQHSGYIWETKTDNLNYIIENYHFKNTNIWHSKKSFILNNRNIYATSQFGFKILMQYLYKTKINDSQLVKPDEVYVTLDDNKNIKHVKIIEKKTQSCIGSCDTKILATHALKLKTQYQLRYITGSDIAVEYALCLNDWFKGDKYVIDLTILNHDYKINTFYGNDIDYYKKVNNWLGIAAEQNVIGF